MNRALRFRRRLAWTWVAVAGVLLVAFYYAVRVAGEAMDQMARQTLVNLGYRVLSAADGGEALRLCAEDTPAIAILDVVMPKLGGVASAQKLTANFRGLPVIFTGGYSQDSENVSAAAANAHYLQKPYSPMALGRQVREILDQIKAGKRAK